MQRLNRIFLLRKLHREFKGERLLLILLLFLVPGCGGTAANPVQQDKPFQGVSLTVSCTDQRLRSLVEPMIRIWSERTGAKVELRGEAMQPGDGIDAAVASFAELGPLAARGELLPLPAAYKDPAHPLQWSAILGVYRDEAYSGWGAQTYGLPLAAEGRLILYRADRFADPQVKADFRQRFNRPLAVPAVWEEFADAAAFFAGRDKRPSVAFDTRRLDDLFFRIAACYDRPVNRDKSSSRSEALEFQFRLGDGKPRLDGPAFVEAARRLADLKKSGALLRDSTDPIEALEKRGAVLAVVSLADVMRLKHNQRIDSRYGIAPLPGTQAVIDPATGRMTFTPNNFAPFFSGGWLGIVRRDCKNPDAAFDLIAELGSPARALQLVASGGYGPLRESHLESDRLLPWLDYGFDERRSKDLQEALLAYVGKQSHIPTYGLRAPDRKELRSRLLGELSGILNGAPVQEGLRRAVDLWERADPGVPGPTLVEWRRRSVGLN